MLNLILYDLSFNDKLETFFTEQNFAPESGKVYQTIGIIGCQSSGKSTLLNHIFNTKFEIMSDDIGRAQTTKGIWIAVNKEYKTIIFDVEGTDSKERGDDRLKFEQCSSLFTLAMSDVLMINMWTNDIGRYTASNYGVLKVVFEQNLKLFQQESEKKIIIVLRDFDDKVDDITKLKESIMADMIKIWNEIPKPDEFKGQPCSKYFKFEFLTLAHKFYKTEKFNQGIEEIKERLIRGKDDKKTGANANSIFNLVDYEKNVPIEGFYKYCLNIWTSILNNKDLNIPGQKEMLARFKCDEIKMTSLALVEQKINDLEMESASNVMPDFGTKAKEIVKEALDNYDSLAKNYLAYIYQDVRKSLEEELANKMYSAFSNQLKRLIPKYQKKFRTEFEEELKKNDNFYQVSDKLKNKYLSELESELKKLQIFKIWDTGSENQVIFDELIENQRTICLEENKEKLLEQYKTFIEDTISNKFEIITNDFWVEFMQEIFLLITQNLLAQKNYLSQTYRITDDEYIKFVDVLEDQIYSNIKTQFNQQLPSFPNMQIDNFKKDFWYIDGIPKVWNKLTVSQISFQYKEVSEKYKKTFELLRKLRVIKHPLKLCEYGNLSSEDFSKIEKEKIPELINDINGDYEPLLDDKTLLNYIRKYEEGIYEYYDDAIRRHNNVASIRIPFVAWLLLIYVGYKDIWRMMTGYGLILIIILVGLFSILRMVGLGSAPMMLINLIKNQISSAVTKAKID